MRSEYDRLVGRIIEQMRTCIMIYEDPKRTHIAALPSHISLAGRLIEHFIQNWMRE